MKKITVLMSVYNEKIDELKESIESILNQTYKEYEFIIINDGNNEEITNFISNYKDDRIKLLNNKENIGLARSLNKGIERAKGEYIVRMDADDVAYLDRIEKQLEFIENNKDYAIVSARAEIFDENGTYKKTTKKGEVSKKSLIKGNQFIHPAMIINKKVLKKIGGYPDYRRAQDYAMVMDLYANGYKGYIMDEILLKYRMGKDGYKKKQFKYRVMEMKIRLKYFRKMKVDFFSYIYVFKPIVVGVIPKRMLEAYHKRKKN